MPVQEALGRRPISKEVINPFQSPEGFIARSDLLGQEWRVITQNRPPFEVRPYVEGSHLVQLGPQEWVMTKDGESLPYTNSYSKDNPIPMRAWHAPNAGAQARRIMESGRTPEELLSTEKEVSLKKGMEHTRAFMNLFTRKGGKQTSRVAAISTGLISDRQTRVDECMREISDNVLKDATIIWFGPHKFLAFAKRKYDVDELLEKFVDAPREPYNKYLKHLAKAQNMWQDKRVVDILDPDTGTGNEFIADSNGRNTELTMAFREEGDSFPYAYDEINGELIGINPDGKKQSMTSLIKRAYSQDFDMQNMLSVLQDYFTDYQEVREGPVRLGDLDNGSEDLWALMVTFDETAVCCGFSSNAQQNGLFGESFDPSEIGKLDQHDKYIPGSMIPLQKAEKHTCHSCGEIVTDEHTCKQSTVKELVA